MGVPGTPVQLSVPIAVGAAGADDDIISIARRISKEAEELSSERKPEHEAQLTDPRHPSLRQTRIFPMRPAHDAPPDAAHK